ALDCSNSGTTKSRHRMFGSPTQGCRWRGFISAYVSQCVWYEMTMGRLKRAASSVAVPLATRATSQAASTGWDWPVTIVRWRGAGDAVLRQQLRLEGEDAQHVVAGALEFLDALHAPGPDRGADEVHGLDAAALEVFLEPEVEVRGVDADEDVRPLLQQPVAQRIADAHDLAVVP